MDALYNTAEGRQKGEGWARKTVTQNLPRAVLDSIGGVERIRAMSMGLRTMTTEGGHTFSDGQVQRVLIARANVKSAVGFLQALIEAVPYTIHIVLTDNGIQFGDMPSRRTGPTARYRLHMFDRICREHGIEHRLTKPNHPWTNGQVERMNRTLKEATVRRYHYETHQQLREHLEAFLNACNFAKRLKTLKGLTPYEHICKAWADQPTRFRYDPTHLTSGLNT